MSCIVYQTNKRSGITYAYESVSYWDPEKKQPRSKRRYIGRVDPETGEIIASKRGREPEDSSTAVRQLQKELHEKDALIASLQEEVRSLKEKYAKAAETLEMISTLTKPFTEKHDA